MDVIVKASAGFYLLTDLLGRPMGSIVEDGAGQFTIRSLGLAADTMTGMKHGPFACVDDALAEIERHTRGVCRREPTADQTMRVSAGEDHDGSVKAD